MSNVIAEAEGSKPLTHPDYAAMFFPNTTVQPLGPAGHFAQEDVPVEMGAKIAAFVTKNSD